MMYDPDKHHRRSLRFKEYDYSKAGAYFVTICTRKKEWYFDNFPELKTIVNTVWKSLPERFPGVQLDAFVIMPNHIHGIVIIVKTNHDRNKSPETNECNASTQNVGATLAVALKENRAGASPAPTLGDVIGSFKSICVKRWLKYIRDNEVNGVGSFWQRNYYDRIIRNDREYDRIRRYIAHNPLSWHLDRENEQSVNSDIPLEQYYRGVFDE